MLTSILNGNCKFNLLQYPFILLGFSQEKQEGSSYNPEERRITMLIKMRELSSTAFDVEDADLLKVEIEKALAQEEKIIIDFEEIDFFSAVFFNHAFLHYAKSLGKQKYDDTFFLINLDEIGEEDYNDFYNNVLKNPRKFSPNAEKRITEFLSDLD